MSFFDETPDELDQNLVREILTDRARSRQCEDLAAGRPVVVAMVLLSSTTPAVPSGRRWVRICVGPGYLVLADLFRLRRGRLLATRDVRAITAHERDQAWWEREYIRPVAVTLELTGGGAVELAASEHESTILHMALDMHGCSGRDERQPIRRPLPLRGFGWLPAVVGGSLIPPALLIEDESLPWINALLLVLSGLLLLLAVLGTIRNRFVDVSTARAPGLDPASRG
jgi:hypothetical protein